MARTPSMSVAECEAALGTRGNVRVSSENRATVRKWLTAQGLPALFVGGLSMTELQLAYNDTSGQGLDKIKNKLAETAGDIQSEDEGETPQGDKIAMHNAIVSGNGPQFPNPNAGAQPDIIGALQALIAASVPKASGIDESAVCAIMRRELPNLIPTTRIEIVTPEGTKDMGSRPMHKKLPLLIKCLAQGLPVMLVGPAGSGKTTGAEMAFEALGIPCYIEGAVDGEHKLTGFKDAQGNYQSRPFRAAYEGGGGFIKDEIDGDDPNALLTLNAALANGYMAFPDQTLPVKRHESFRIVGCANTYGNGADRQYVGRNQLDAATLDRFIVIDWGYDEKLESALCPNEDWLKRVQTLRAAVELEHARVIISPRASIYGAKLLAGGVPLNQVEEITIWKGIDKELRKRIEAQAR